jgi:hypothetical protein
MCIFATFFQKLASVMEQSGRIGEKRQIFGFRQAILQNFTKEFAF